MSMEVICDEDFNVLDWWKLNVRLFPILAPPAIMALVTPIKKIFALEVSPWDTYFFFYISYIYISMFELILYINDIPTIYKSTWKVFFLWLCIYYLVPSLCPDIVRWIRPDILLVFISQNHFLTFI